MAGLRLLSIKTKEIPLRVKFNFAKVRECGDLARGFACAFLVGLLDNLILAQSTLYANWQFVDKVMRKYFTSEVCPKLVEVFNRIVIKTADHNDFAAKCRNDEEFIEELKVVSMKMFDLDSESIEPSPSVQIMEKLSLEFNVQIKVYDDERVIDFIKKNKYMNALVVSIYAKKSDNIFKFYSLYHQNFKIIAPENLNADFEYDMVEAENDDIRILDSLVNDTFRILFHRPPRSEMRNDWANVYYQLKKRYRKTWGFEKKLADIRKDYAVSLEKCVLCKKVVHRYKLSCSCGYCLECLNAFSVVDNCLNCNKRLKGNDSEFLDQLRF